MSAGVSDSGRYAITAHRDNSLILWDIKEEKWKTLNGKANVYSATFAPDRDVFLWQDLNDRVKVQTVTGEELLNFNHFPTYGHLMSSDMATYVSADQEWNVFTGYGDNKTPVLKDGISPSFTGSGKLLNLAMAEGKSYFITAGSGDDDDPIEDYAPIDDDRRFSRYSGVTLWNTDTGKPVAKFQGNSSKTHATISPDGQWVVSADEAGIGLFWNTDRPDVRHRLARYHSGIYLEDTPFETGDPRNRDKSGLIEAPRGAHDFTIAVAFIHNSEYYLRFGNNSHMAALFKTGSPWPVKYFDLGESPKLVTYGSNYDRNTAIATSPETGILAMGHQSSGGISVYQFDPDELTLDRVWVVE
ncbi:MAG: WD40 repeat domain-containing protein [Marinobacter sp.]|uniref:WD40 repeat domain-containing protein n=1 Tax=Marinobacter sp. TaxID=50741 RepID=UPI003F966084